MVVSINPDPDKVEFQKLLDNTLSDLQNHAKADVEKYLLLLGHKLEKTVFDILELNAKGTVFEGSIELVSGQRFPDIVANQFYGIEVKTTKSNHWTSMGSSIAEGTRVKTVERIYMLFGKMVDPVEFMCKPYEQCLSEVVVTHSPRYSIDMMLEPGQTIFDKINIPYDQLRNEENPIKTVLNFYRSKLRKGDQVWWLDQDVEQASSLIIRVWNNLTNEERRKYLFKAFTFFPEVMSNKNNKFNAFAVWLSTTEGVVCPNVRDIFSASGQGTIIFEGKSYDRIPQIIIRLLNNVDDVYVQLSETSNSVLSEFWSLNVTEENKYRLWLEQFSENAEHITRRHPVILRVLERRFY